MATSAKRKQEETHLKMLREMTSLPANRKCFDCDQRGPTYVNMTVGSFVCTTCSGILRGLNPPHRVKSISMTTFTQQEIEFLQKHSNEVCKHIWLGLYDDRTSVVPDFREPQKVKEFLQEKYEKKRWYVPPDQVRAVVSVQASVSGSSASSTGSTPEVQPLKTLHLNKTPLRQSPGLSRSQAHATAQEKKFDLLSDLGGDIFAAPSSQTASATNFANFAQFPGQSGGIPIPSLSSSTAAHSHSHSHSGSSAQDRYAALAELDNELSTSASSVSSVQGNIFGPALGSSPAHNTSVLPSMQPGFGAVPSTNPFVAAAVPPDMATNPFQTNGRAPPAGPAFPVYAQNKPSVAPFGQPVAIPGMTNNPFMAGAPAGSFPSGASSTNPFL
ncbi:arf-GAP domain and FG repeat-containing protein 1b isoform X2 [Gouania willdenowi]|uniref:arf-GAP domain and FG repeat-containing protein 1b isoform X2 n=1 Tax=Gouania willdenowi TaxID=441366 RepID=UPI00105560CA|nr:arf-GAP domain and FG repeat-containing protein 1-like isoform X2 [Gouania willdenowi]